MVLNLRRLEAYLDWLENHPAEAKTMGQSGYVHLEGCKIHAVTDAAILVGFDPDGDGEVVEWFPKSQVADADDFEKGDTDVTVSITEWIAKKLNIEVEP